jgi:hypothetical protein
MMKSFGITVSLLMGIFAPAQLHAGNSLIIAEPSAYARSVKNWTATVAKNGLDGTSWIGPILGNGVGDRKHRNRARDTVLYVPGTTNIQEDTMLVLYFHGLGGFSKREFMKRVGPNLRALSTGGTNFIFVFPELPWSINTTTPRSRQGHVWNGRSDKENIVVFYGGVLNTVRKLTKSREFKPSSVVTVGHSAGGSAIRMAALSGGLDVIQPSKIVFSDAGYGRWTDQAWRGYVKNHSECRLVLLVRKWDRPYRNTIRFLKRFRKVPDNIELHVFDRRKYTHTSIGDQSLLWVRR